MKTFVLFLSAALFGFGMTVGALATSSTSPVRPSASSTVETPVVLPTIVVRPSPEERAKLARTSDTVTLPTIVVRPERTPATASVYAGATAWGRD